jgi:hypothetical protein
LVAKITDVGEGMEYRNLIETAASLPAGKSIQKYAGPLV